VPIEQAFPLPRGRGTGWGAEPNSGGWACVCRGVASPGKGAFASPDKGIAIRPDWLRYKGQSIQEGGKLWQEAILDDFKEFAERGLKHRQIARIKALLAAK